MTTKMEELKKEIIDKSNYMVSITSTITKTETWLIENETEEDAKYIATDQNQSKLHKCTLWNEDESDPEFDDEAIVKEVSFEKDEKGKYNWIKKEKENGMRELKEDLFPKEVKGSDVHPVVSPIKPVDIKSITIELEDNQLVLKLGGIVRNKHTSPAAETKFTQILMLIKDQFANWNAINGNKEN